MTDTLRVQLAEALGWEYYPYPQENPHCALSPQRMHQWFNRNDGNCYREENVPPLSELIRTAEQGLSEEQKRAYAIRRVLNVGYFLERGPELSPDDIFKLITETDDRKAAALVEVLKGGRA